MRYLITPKCISLNYDGNTKVVEKTDSRFQPIIDAIKAKNFDVIPGIIDGLKNAIATSTNKDFKVDNGLVYIDNKSVGGRISEKIVEYVNAGLDPISLVNFWRNLQLNPSYRAREALFSFLENGNHPITDDGHFIAYKKVRSNMKDGHNGTFDNSVGAKPSMPRDQVDDDPTHTCAPGLHVASWEYAQNYSGTVLIDCKVNPMNVVAVPIDYNFMKMRTCGYEVIAVAKEKRQELHISDNKDITSDDATDIDPDDINLNDNNEDFDYNNMDNVDYQQGVDDANALITYFKSIGREYTYDEFIELKRFENKSDSYKCGIEEVADEKLS
jgi:hypothetical protein